MVDYDDNDADDADASVRNCLGQSIVSLDIEPEVK